MVFNLPLEKYTNKICEVKIGVEPNSITVGGESTMPYLFKEGSQPHKPAMAMEILDVKPQWPDVLMAPFKNVVGNPVDWARKCVDEFGADIICLKLEGAHPDSGNKTAEECQKVVGEILNSINIPLIILGCGDDEKDKHILPAVSFAAKGKNCLIGDATEDNYRTLTASCLADGHNIIAESPIDINIAKQLNILISEMGMPVNKIVINPTIGGLGYGMEYGYSIMERARLAALGGDNTLACPFICFVGQEAWRAKEAYVSEKENPQWGSEEKRGILWEAVTAVSMLQAGADILIMRHPDAVREVKKYIASINLILE